MAGAMTGTVVAVKVFVKWDQVVPVRIVLKFLGAAEDRTATVVIPQKDICETPGNFSGNSPVD